MRHDRRRSPRLEPLEVKQLLSTAHAHPAHLSQSNLPLDGVLSVILTAPGVGAASGQAGAMGQVSGTDRIVRIVNRAKLELAHQLDIANAQGSVRVSYVPMPKLRVDPSSEILTVAQATYRITSGTGAYQGATGSGTITESTDMNTNDDNSYEPQLVFHSKPA